VGEKTIQVNQRWHLGGKDVRNHGGKKRNLHLLDASLKQEKKQSQGDKRNCSTAVSTFNNSEIWAWGWPRNWFDVITRWYWKEWE